MQVLQAARQVIDRVGPLEDVNMRLSRIEKAMARPVR
jgi:hypothetical protein